jgi:hypothetical protein
MTHLGAYAGLALALTLSFPLHAQNGPSSPPAAQLSLGGATLQNWTGLKPASNGAAELDLPDSAAVYTVPDGPKGWSRPTWFQMENDGVIDARPWYGFRFDMQLDRDDTPFTVDLTVAIPDPQPERHNLPPSTSAQMLVQGKGWHTVTVPFSSFDYNRGQVGLLKFLKRFTFKGHYGEPAPPGKGDRVLLRNVRLVRGNVIHLDAEVRSSPADVDGSVTYPVTITNCADTPQIVALTLQRSGWEGMLAEITPATLNLRPGESKSASLRVKVPALVPPGAQETQVLVATPQGENATPEKMEFITLRRLPFPYLVHDKAGWDEVRAKVTKYDWAKADANEIIKKSDAWNVPTAYPNNRAPDGTLCVFKSYIEGDLRACAIAWQLTGDKKYADKAALFLRRLADPATGYPATRHANSQGIPQEGGFFEGCAQTYDAIYNSGSLCTDDKQKIEQTFRLYIGVIEDMMGDGGISNWSVFNLCPAAECALALQDMAQFNYLMNGSCGVIDQLRYGMMDDGWWYEMALSYNLGVASAFTSLANAAQPFGIDFLHQKFPVALTTKVGLRPFEFENYLGMAFGKYGPIKNNTVTLKQMWDGIVLFPDYRGVIFGMGDGHETNVAGSQFELAYYVFRDPAYAAVIKQGTKRDLLFGVPKLPQDTPKLYTLSGHSDNAGIAVLRSQTAGREPREQIQAAFKYGSHGSYHGHFDRISFLSLMRYGRSFYSPESTWFGYGSYMYKWWVQTSLAHNMVVVDAKMQEPAECRLLLFHTGPMLQAVAAETNARWSNPPYFGGYDQIDKVKAMNPPPIVVPENHPKPGDVIDFTEPVRQRRLVLVTDDYVVLVDDLQAAQEHQFDNLLHLRGAVLAGPSQVHLEGHDNQFDSNPLGSGQFITNCDRYSGTAPIIIHSADPIPEKNDTRSEPGMLQINEHIYTLAAKTRDRAGRLSE